MTLPTTKNTIIFEGNNTARSFDCPFKAFLDTDIVATLIDPEKNKTTLRLNVDYSVSMLDENTGFEVKYPLDTEKDPLPENWKLEIVRIVPLTQDTDLPIYGKYSPEVIERVFDYLTMIDQQQKTTADKALALGTRAVKYDEDDTSPNINIPNAETRKEKYLGFDDVGNLTVIDPFASDHAKYLDTIIAELVNATAPSVLVIDEVQGVRTIRAKNLLQIFDDSEKSMSANITNLADGINAKYLDGVVAELIESPADTVLVIDESNGERYITARKLLRIEYDLDEEEEEINIDEIINEALKEVLL